ncbi:MAG TPA: rhodanese-like domain-containing protein [Candidatus Bathyarchaeia archaeon]|nr:rhodanese-like domain-containing protein [Candidatus Bathyarchaeia archaeon]
MRILFRNKLRGKWVLSLIICGIILIQNINQVTGVDYENISSIEAKNRLEIDPNIFLLDVRSSYEFYEDGHILGAININVYYLSYSKEILPSSNETGILVYCDDGLRSKTAAQKLCEYGYNNVSNMEDGFNGWKDNGFPYIIGTDPSQTSDPVPWKVLNFSSCFALLILTIAIRSRKNKK